MQDKENKTLVMAAQVVVSMIGLYGLTIILFLL